MIQICDSSHMNISTFCFAFWQSPIFPRHPTQTARYVLALINHRYIHLAILVRDNSLQRRGQHGARGAARSVAPMDHPPLEEDVPITRLADRNPMLNASSQRKMNNELAKCSIYGDISKERQYAVLRPVLQEVVTSTEYGPCVDCARYTRLIKIRGGPTSCQMCWEKTKRCAWRSAALRHCQWSHANSLRK